MIIGIGAEAVLEKTESSLFKNRVSKGYRIKEIDDKLRSARTRREAKVLKKLNEANFPCPKILNCDNKSIIEMEFLNGDKLRDILEEEHFIKRSEELGKLIHKLHGLKIIHGDLTTSNMILKDDKIYLIDFGLAQFSDKDEHKAVDLHLLKQALESSHHTIWEKCFMAVLKAYNNKTVLKRLEEVELRGRYKRKAC